MASSAEIMQPLPDTLPEDFSEWDSGHSASARPVDFNLPAAAPVDSHATRPPSQSANRQYSAVAASEASSDLPRYTAGNFDATDEFLLRSFRLKEASEPSPKGASKKKTIAMGVAGAVVPILLLLLFFPGVSSGLRFKLSHMKQSMAGMSSSADKNLADNTPKPSPEEPMTAIDPSSTITSNPSPSPKSPAGAYLSTPNSQQVTPPAVESKMMTDQLTAPSQIPHGITTVASDEAPPSSGTDGAAAEALDGNGANLVHSVMSVGNNGPTVSPELVKPETTKVTISSGVAAGMLLHGAKPQYPAIAKTAHVSGTVVLQATISKAGTIENLRADSGPMMLRQAAMDAVSTWRYRPYKLNGEPVAISTTVSVVFNVNE